MTLSDHDASTDAECPLDVSGWEPEAVIARWRAAFRWANGWDSARTVTYERGWFVFRAADGFFFRRWRRRQVAGAIWRMENRPRATEARTMTIEKINDKIAMWEGRRKLWLMCHDELAHLGSTACLDEIEKLRRQRAQFDETISKRGEVK